MLKQDEYERVISSLVAFVERSAKGEATPAEIAALPEVARILLGLN